MLTILLVLEIISFTCYELLPLMVKISHASGLLWPRSK